MSSTYFWTRRQSAVAGAANRNAVGNGGGRGQGHGFACGDRCLHRGQPRRLHSNDLDFRIRFLDGAGDAADQSASANGDHHRLDFRMLLQHFKSEGALAGDDRIVIEGVDESEVLLFTAPDGFFTGLVVVGAVKNDFGAVGLGGGNLDQRRRERHANLGFDPAPAGVIRQSLRVVSRRSCNHSLIAFLRAHGQQFVQRAALFKRARPLQVVEFQINGIAGELRKSGGQSAGRKIDRRANALQCSLDVGESDHWIW